MTLFISNVGVGHDTFPAKQGRSIRAEGGYIGVAYSDNQLFIKYVCKDQRMLYNSYFEALMMCHFITQRNFRSHFSDKLEAHVFTYT